MCTCFLFDKHLHLHSYLRLLIHVLLLLVFNSFTHINQNTFIDDLFAFIIRMPTMARMSCFRDDVVFFVYLWQRYLYPVDTSRPVEGGGVAETDAVQEKEKGTKQKQS